MKGKFIVHPTTLPSRLDGCDQPGQAGPTLSIPCGCKVELFNHHGIKVVYCERHESFVFSPRYNGSDVFYFVTPEQEP
jgi:hypothetical protein